MIIPVEEHDDRQWVTVNSSVQWIRKLMTGTQAYNEYLAVAIGNVQQEVYAAKEEALVELREAKDQRDQEIKEIVKSKAKQLDVSESEDEEDSVPEESPRKKARIIRAENVMIKFHGVDLKVKGTQKTLKFEADGPAIHKLLTVLYTEFVTVKNMGLQKKLKQGVDTWLSSQGLSAAEVAVPKVPGKVFYCPSMSAWTCKITTKTGDSKNYTQGLKVALTSPGGNPLSAVDQMKAIQVMFPTAVDAWNSNDYSSKKRIDVKDYL